MNQRVYLSFFLLLPMLLPAQLGVNTSGGTAQFPTHIVEYAIGEVVVASGSNATNLVTAGVLQPLTTLIDGIDSEQTGNYELHVYPNPVSDFLTIETDYVGDLQIEVCNDLGQAILTQTAQNQAQIDLRTWAIGTYYFRVFDSNHHFSKTIHIIRK